MSSTGHCVPSTTAAGRDGAGVSLSGKTGMSSVDSSEEEGEDGVSTWGQWRDDGEEDGEAAESGDGDGDGDWDEDDEDDDGDREVEDDDGEDEDDDEEEDVREEDEDVDEDDDTTHGQ